METLFDLIIHGQLNILSVTITLFFGAIMLMMFNQRQTLRCTDLITDKQGHISRVAIAECAGIIVCVTIPVYQTVHGNVEPTIFGTCVGALFWSAGWSKHLRTKADIALNSQEKKNGV